MFCTVCGAEVSQGSLFCPICGAQLQQPVPQQMQPQMQQPVPQQMQPQMQQPVPQQMQPQMQQPMPQQGSMNQVMQQHEYARQMQQQFSQQTQDAEREVTRTMGMSMPNAQPQRPTPYPSVQQGEMSQSIIPGDNQVSQQFPMMMQQPAPQSMPQTGKKLPKNKAGVAGKKSKLPLILIIIALALIVAAVVVFVVIKPFGKKKNAQTKALDRYFDAINDLDFKAIDEACYPLEIKNNYTVGLEDRCGYNSAYTNYMGFGRGCASIDYFRAEQGILESYPMFDMRNYPDADAYQDMMNNNERFQELYKDFSASYELEALYAWDEATLEVRNGLKKVEIADMDELITYMDENDDKQYLDIDDAYIAEIKVKWYYDDMLFGFDMGWWRDPQLKKKLENVPNYDTYENAISLYEDFVWTVVIYQYKGEWYVFPERLSSALNIYSVEMK